MAVRLAANPQMTRTRRNTVEHPFGTIKHAMNQGHFLMKGLRQVQAEFSLSALAYNLLRAINIVSIKTLVEALRRRLRAFAGAAWRVYDLGGWFYACPFAWRARCESNFVAVGLLAWTNRCASVFTQPHRTCGSDFIGLHAWPLASSQARAAITNLLPRFTW